MRMFGLALALAVAAPMAAAQTVDSRAAKKMLFSERGGNVQVADVDFLPGDATKALEKAAAQIPYYGAIAVSPGEPTASNLMAAMGNHHSVDAASSAALANCNARRTSGKPCVVIAVITPKKYKARPLTMSAEATRVFKKEYSRLKKPRGMAISPATGVFGIDRGDGGRALSRCNTAAKALGATDCRLVIADQ